MKLARGWRDDVAIDVSVSADGSKGVKPSIASLSIVQKPGFSIRRWIEGCEANIITRQEARGKLFQYPQMDRRV